MAVDIAPFRPPLAFIDTCPEQFPIESVLVDDFADYGGSDLKEETVRNADLSRPILLAEIAPGRCNVIDGNHRLARVPEPGAKVYKRFRRAGSAARITFPS